MEGQKISARLLKCLENLGINPNEMPLRFVGKINSEIKHRNQDDLMFEGSALCQVEVKPTAISVSVKEGETMMLPPFENNSAFLLEYEPEIGDMIYDYAGTYYYPKTRQPLKELWVAVAKTGLVVKWVKFYNLFPDKESERQAQIRMTAKDIWEVRLKGGGVIKMMYDPDINYFPCIREKESKLFRQEISYKGNIGIELSDNSVVEKNASDDFTFELGDIVTDKNNKVFIAVLDDDILKWKFIDLSGSTQKQSDKK